MGPGKRGAGSGRYLGERKGEGQKTLACGDVRGAGGKTAQSEQVARSGFCFSNEKEKW